MHMKNDITSHVYSIYILNCHK